MAQKAFHPSVLGITLEGRYYLEKKLGEGGMAEVFLAQDTNDGSSVVLKTPKRGLLLDNPTVVSRFRGEVNAMSQLDHPNIVKIHDAVTFEDRPFMVMHYCSGGTLVGASNTRRPPTEMDRPDCRLA